MTDVSKGMGKPLTSILQDHSDVSVILSGAKILAVKPAPELESLRGRERSCARGDLLHYFVVSTPASLITFAHFTASASMKP